MLVVEERGRVGPARGAKWYGELAGYGATFDPAPGSDAPRGCAGRSSWRWPTREVGSGGCGRGLRRRRRRHAEAGPAEAAALAGVFGAHGVPVTAPKTMTGPLVRRRRPLDVAAALLAMRDSVIPPAAGVSELAPDCPVDLVLDVPREARVRTALVLARGYRGFNAALVVRTVD